MNILLLALKHRFSVLFLCLLFISFYTYWLKTELETNKKDLNGALNDVRTCVKHREIDSRVSDSIDADLDKWLLGDGVIE